MKKLSVVISAFNEEEKIKDALESVSFADEIIVVDHESTDKTQNIARTYTKEIFTQKNNPLQIDLQKNFGFSKAHHEWILSLDADERVTPELQQEIKEILSQESSMSGYWIPRKNIIFGKWIEHGLWWPDYQLRLFKAGQGKFSSNRVHEYLQVDGETAKLRSPILHLNYETISQYLIKMMTLYSENEMTVFLESGKKITWIDAIRFPIDDFLKTFFARRGYKDGLHGLALSILQAFYAEVVFLKVWEKQGFKQENSQHFLQDFEREFRTIHKEFRYWFLTAIIDQTQSKFKKPIYRILRKRVKK